MGLVVVVSGEWEARGMELVVRSVDRGCGGLVGLDRGREVVVVDVEAEVGGKDEGDGSGGDSLLAAAASSHAARAEGSIGHAEGGGSFGGD